MSKQEEITERVDWDMVFALWRGEVSHPPDELSWFSASVREPRETVCKIIKQRSQVVDEPIRFLNLEMSEETIKKRMEKSLKISKDSV